MAEMDENGECDCNHDPPCNTDEDHRQCCQEGNTEFSRAAGKYVFHANDIDKPYPDSEHNCCQHCIRQVGQWNRKKQ